MRCLAISLLLLACHTQSPPPSPPPPTTQTETPPPTQSGSATAQGPGPTLGKACGPNDSCDAPATCVHYRGIAGMAGPDFSSCEVKCTDDAGCPSGKKCHTIADGPGQVCR